MNVICDTARTGARMGWGLVKTRPLSLSYIVATVVLNNYWSPSYARARFKLFPQELYIRLAGLAMVGWFEPAIRKNFVRRLLSTSIMCAVGFVTIEAFADRKPEKIVPDGIWCFALAIAIRCLGPKLPNRFPLNWIR